MLACFALDSRMISASSRHPDDVDDIACCYRLFLRIPKRIIVRTRPALTTDAKEPGQRLQTSKQPLNKFLILERPSPHHTIAHCPCQTGLLWLQVVRLLKAAGARRHLLEQADFWALNELADLAGGRFAALPPWLDRAARKCSDLAAAVLLAEAAQPPRS